MRLQPFVVVMWGITLSGSINTEVVLNYGLDWRKDERKSYVAGVLVCPGDRPGIRCCRAKLAVLHVTRDQCLKAVRGGGPFTP